MFKDITVIKVHMGWLGWYCLKNIEQSTLMEEWIIQSLSKMHASMPTWASMDWEGQLYVGFIFFIFFPPSSYKFTRWLEASLSIFTAASQQQFSRIAVLIVQGSALQKERKKFVNLLCMFQAPALNSTLLSNQASHICPVIMCISIWRHHIPLWILFWTGETICTF